ncbi:MAG TPA: metal-dependent hydrolase [Steroidobacteraceae bacterium]|nr:metal-dependent hydrolase [Steroidobacteraceae bacterium]
MDSLSHLALGAAVGTAVLGRKAAPRAALLGAACATLPDLDVLVQYGDPVRDFTYHRAATHSIFWLSVVAPGIAWLLARLRRAADDRAGVTYKEWWLLAWLALVTHALLDACTVYGTQLLLPFSDYPIGLGSVFIIDPLYTVPVAGGLAAALALRRRDPGRADRWNAAGLAVSTAYLAWALAAQADVVGHLNRTLAATPLADGRTLVTPTPFNTLLWRVLVMDDGAYYEGYVSLFDQRDRVELVRHDNPTRLVADLQQDWAVRRLAWFSKGFYGVREAGPGVRVATRSTGSARQLFGLVETASAEQALPGRNPAPIVMTDLRMGQTPWFVFAFVVAERRGDAIVPVVPRQVPASRPPGAAALSWLWRRIWDEDARLAYSSSQMRET